MQFPGANEVTGVPLGGVLEIGAEQKSATGTCADICCECLSDAYDQLNTLAFCLTVHRLVKVLLRLGDSWARAQGIDGAVGLSNEGNMKFHRNRGMLDYSHRDYLVLDLQALQNYSD